MSVVVAISSPPMRTTVAAYPYRIPQTAEVQRGQPLVAFPPIGVMLAEVVLDVLLAEGATIPVVLVMVSVDHVPIRIPGARGCLPQAPSYAALCRTAATGTVRGAMSHSRYRDGTRKDSLGCGATGQSGLLSRSWPPRPRGTPSGWGMPPFAGANRGLGQAELRRRCGPVGCDRRIVRDRPRVAGDLRSPRPGRRDTARSLQPPRVDVTGNSSTGIGSLRGLLGPRPDRLSHSHSHSQAGLR